MNRIGIMQGRLSPPRDGRIQSFPVESWEEEFPRAKEAGLDCIEWICEKETGALNPLSSDDGIRKILGLVSRWGVGARSICADYYMADLLLDARGGISDGAAGHLTWLIGRARLLGARYIILPFVDDSSLAAGRRRAGLPDLVTRVLPATESAGVELHLETDLPPEDLRKLLAGIDHPLIRANYDIGNSASLGFDTARELELIGEFIGSVHVKDRVRGGGSVPLGEGDADLPLSFRLLRDIGYGGTYILQAARGPGGEEVELAARNRMLVSSLLSGLPA
ncbi:MAG TPA: TIM barrel protein [Methanomicrobiales archaeon]|nr:TIM barrel protein [Methanomicrobiales archaeon]